MRKEGRYAEAKAALERALTVEPNNYKQWVEYGSLFFDERDFDRALASFRQAIAVEPTCAPAFGNIGRIELIRGNYAQALAASRDAAAANPRDPIYRKQLAWLLATSPDAGLRDGQEALALVDSIKQRKSKTDIQWHEVRAAALAELGRFDEAVLTAGRMISAAESIRSKRLDELRAQLAAYQAGRPWRLPTRAEPAVAAK
jgi:Flp pilus assembly protein TadD